MRIVALWAFWSLLITLSIFSLSWYSLLAFGRSHAYKIGTIPFFNGNWLNCCPCDPKTRLRDQFKHILLCAKMALPLIVAAWHFSKFTSRDVWKQAICECICLEPARKNESLNSKTWQVLSCQESDHRMTMGGSSKITYVHYGKDSDEGGCVSLEHGKGKLNRRKERFQLMLCSSWSWAWRSCVVDAGKGVDRSWIQSWLRSHVALIIDSLLWIFYSAAAQTYLQPISHYIAVSRTKFVSWKKCAIILAIEWKKTAFLRT